METASQWDQMGWSHSLWRTNPGCPAAELSLPASYLTSFWKAASCRMRPAHMASCLTTDKALYRGGTQSLIHCAKVLSRSLYFLSDFLGQLTSNTPHQHPRLLPDRRTLLALKSISLRDCGLINHEVWYRRSGPAIFSVSTLVRTSLSHSVVSSSLWSYGL